MYVLKSLKYRESKFVIKWNMYVVKWFKFFFFLKLFEKVFDKIKLKLFLNYIVKKLFLNLLYE